jgi:pyrimidine-specific ribonucleoside hydrolase
MRLVPSVPLVVIVDTGVDDALALAVAARHPRVELAGVVMAAGNTDLSRVAANTRFVLDTLQIAPLLARGAAVRSDGSPFPPRAGHQPNGLAGLGPPAVAPARAPVGPAPGRATGIPGVDPVSLLRRRPEAVVLCCAPVTTVAAIAQEDPAVLSGRRIVLTAARDGEPNAAMDPAAASRLGATVPVVHHDLAAFARWSPPPARLPWIPADDAAAGLVAALLDARRRRGAGLGDAGAVLDIAGEQPPGDVLPEDRPGRQDER